MLIDNVKQAEGLRLVAYRDSLGFWTIGYGHKLPAGHDWTGLTWTKETAEKQLIIDLADAREIASHLPEWPHLNDCLMDTITELVFNMGVGKWLGFKKCRLALQAGDLEGAATELLDSLWATQVGPTRSERLANQLKSGKYT